MKKHQRFHGQRHNWFLSLLLLLLIVSGPMYLITLVEKDTGKVQKVFSIVDGQFQLGFIGWWFIGLFLITFFLIVKGPTLWDLFLFTILFYIVFFAQQQNVFDRFNYDEPCSGNFQLRYNGECL